MASEHPLSRVVAMLRQAGAQEPAEPLGTTPESGVNTGLSIALAVLLKQMEPKPMNPWVPISDPLDLKVLGKLGEELGEASAAASRCVIQGLDGTEPVTGKVNREWLEDELADVAALTKVAVERFDLNSSRILGRVATKVAQQKEWHAMLDPRVLTAPAEPPRLPWPKGWEVTWLGDQYQVVRPGDSNRLVVRKDSTLHHFLVALDPDGATRA